MKKAIILGGTNDHIRLIEILKEKGYCTILVDYLDNPVAKGISDIHFKASTTDKESVLKIAQEQKADLVIATCIDSALSTAAFVSEKLGLPFHIDYSTSLALTDKTKMKTIFAEQNIPTSSFIILNELNKQKIDSLRYPLVIKPADANSSKGVTKVNNWLEVTNAFFTAQEISKNKKVIIEEFISGEELSVDVMVTDGDAQIILITENIKSKLNENVFTIIQSKFSKEKSIELEIPIKEIANKIATAFKIQNGPLLIQLINKDGELNVIEFSSRIGGGSKHHYIKAITKYDILNDFINVIETGKSTGTNLQYQANFASIHYCYTKPGVICSYGGFKSLLDENVIDQLFIYKPTNTKILQNTTSSDRPLGYLITAENENELLEKFKQVDQTVKILSTNNIDIMLHSYNN